MQKLDFAEAVAVLTDADPRYHADAYFFLLHLLIALTTGDAAARALVERIVSASATSQEYPNDTFVNQLVYLALLFYFNSWLALAILLLGPPVGYELGLEQIGKKLDPKQKGKEMVAKLKSAKVL